VNEDKSNQNRNLGFFTKSFPKRMSSLAITGEDKTMSDINEAEQADIRSKGGSIRERIS